jgi:hypothetical protein
MPDTQRTVRKCECKYQAERTWGYNVQQWVGGRRSWKDKGNAKTPEATAQLAHRISAELGKPVEFEPWVESYCVGCHRPGEKWIAHCVYETGSETIRLHRSNVCLVAFEDDIPSVFWDGAAAAYKPIVAEAIRSYIGQGQRAGNTREWLAWLISEYISANALNRFPHHEPKLNGTPVFPLDLIPAVLDSLTR